MNGGKCVVRAQLGQEVDMTCGRQVCRRKRHLEYPAVDGATTVVVVVVISSTLIWR